MSGQPGIVNRVSPLSRPTDSYGRTDGRTDEELLTADYQETAVTPTRAYKAIDGLVSVGEVIEAGELWQTDQRHERIRFGERDPIPRHVRAAVWLRDHGRCADCPYDYPSGDMIELDHIVPWSAGGPDTTDNLRLLCQRHNTARSNFVDFARPKRPCTWWCHRCHDQPYTYTGVGHIVCPMHGGWANLLGEWVAPKRCAIARGYAKAIAEGEMPTWHQREQLTSFEHVAYCAHCDAPGMTGVLL